MSLRPAQQSTFDFFRIPVVVEAADACMTSDAGLLPIRQFDERIGMTRGVADAIGDARREERIEHSILDMVRARVYGILAGYEDQNDHDALRHDPAFQLICDRTPGAAPLASQPTLSRFENAVRIKDLFRLRELLVEQFLDAFDEPPKRLTFDVDAVDDPVHGEQQLSLFHGYYDQRQYLPLLISNAETGLFASISLRPGNVHAALGADDDLEFVVTRARQRWPDVHVMVRGDCGFGVPAMYRVCERLGVDYVLGLGGNRALDRRTDALLAEAQRLHRETGQPQRLFATFRYQAKSWTRERQVVAKVECHDVGINRRYVVAERPGAAVLPEATYDEYVMRGEAENRNKEIKTGLAMDRLSDHRFVANLFRLYLHTTALNLLARLRRHARLPVEPPVGDLPAEALTGRRRRCRQCELRRRDPLGHAQPCTWRTLLIKVAAEVIVSTRRVLVRLAANWPYLHLYERIAAAAAT